MYYYVLQVNQYLSDNNYEMRISINQKKRLDEKQTQKSIPYTSKITDLVNAKQLLSYMHSYQSKNCSSNNSRSEKEGGYNLLIPKFTSLLVSQQPHFFTLSNLLNEEEEKNLNFVKKNSLLFHYKLFDHPRSYQIILKEHENIIQSSNIISPFDHIVPSFSSISNDQVFSNNFSLLSQSLNNPVQSKLILLEFSDLPPSKLVHHCDSLQEILFPLLLKNE